MKGLSELENVILDQIEKLNDDSLLSNPEEAELAIKKSDTISNLTRNFVEINRLKLDIVSEMNRNGDTYCGYLGLEKHSK